MKVARDRHPGGRLAHDGLPLDPLGQLAPPPGTTRPIPETPAGPTSIDKRIPGLKAWRLMREAESILDGLVAERVDLDRLERALGLALEARAIHAEMAGPKRRVG